MEQLSQREHCRSRTPQLQSLPGRDAPQSSRCSCTHWPLLYFVHTRTKRPGATRKPGATERRVAKQQPRGSQLCTDLLPPAPLRSQTRDRSAGPNLTLQTPRTGYQYRRGERRNHNGLCLRSPARGTMLVVVPSEPPGPLEIHKGRNYGLHNGIRAVLSGSQCADCADASKVCNEGCDSGLRSGGRYLGAEVVGRDGGRQPRYKRSVGGACRRMEENAKGTSTNQARRPPRTASRTPGMTCTGPAVPRVACVA